MKVDILIATYNSDKTLKRCLDNIFKQTYKDINVIVLDDGSTDNTYEIVSKYDIKYYKNETNKGRGYSRNRLLELSESKYACWCDADDYMLPDKIEKQVEYLQKNTNCNFLSTEMLDMKNELIIGNGCNKAKDINSLTLDILRKSNCINHPTVLFNVDVAKEIGFREMKRNEDWDFYIRLYENGYKVDAIPEKLYVYNL